MQSGNNSSNLITIRPYKISDADDLLSYLGDDKVTRFTRCKTFTSKEESISFINEFCLPHQYCRSICIDDRSIGLLFIRPESGEDRCRAEVGYALSAKYWGQGITVTAMKMAILDGLKMFPGLVRLQATVEIDNKPSQRVLQKLGFLQEGVLRKYTHNKVGVVHILAVSYIFTLSFMDSSRISLHPFKLSDVDDFLKWAWASDDKVTRYLRWNSITSREEALAHLQNVAIPHPWHRSICLDDRSIGYISIFPESREDRCRANCGYALATEYWGQGIATIALRMAVSTVFKELPGLVRINAMWK